ncbi:hypothetical protein CU560_08245 [Serratia ureilytica]|nr:hypothetical protein CU560_08245 [Serratia ureilytica]
MIWLLRILWRGDRYSSLGSASDADLCIDCKTLAEIREKQMAGLIPLLYMMELHQRRQEGDADELTQE